MIIQGQPTLWDVQVDLSDLPQQPGFMDVVKDHPNGGSFQSFLPVQPRLTFTQIEPPTFQVQVPSSGPALARFVYADVQQPRAGGGASATIGYQAGGFAVDVQWGLNIPGAVSDGTVLTLTDMGAVGTSSEGPSGW